MANPEQQSAQKITVPDVAVQEASLSQVPSKPSHIHEQFQGLYDQFHQLEFRDPSSDEKAWLNENDLPEDLQFRNPLRIAASSNLNLKKRALSFTHAAYLAIETQKGEVEATRFREHFLKQLAIFGALVDANGSAYNENDFYKKFVEVELNNYLYYLSQELKRNLGLKNDDQATKLLDTFEKIANWQRPQFAFASIIDGKNGQQTLLISEPENLALTPKQEKEYNKMSSVDKKPQWFTDLPELVQTWFVRNKTHITEGDFGNPQAVFRKIPGMANVWCDTTIIKDRDGNVLAKDSSQRHSIATVVGIKDQQERMRLTKQNAQQLVDSVTTANPFRQFWGEDFAEELSQQQNFSGFTIEQSLLSPLSFFDALYKIPLIGRLFNYNDNNTRMLAENQQAFAEASHSQVITSNWPINSGRFFSPSPFKNKNNIQTKQRLDQSVYKVCQQLVGSGKLTNNANKLAKAFNEQGELVNQNALSVFIIEAESQKASLTNNVFNGDASKTNQFIRSLHALVEYHLLWDHHEANPQKVNVNMIMASLEEVIAQGIGVKTTGGCKTSKDRRATQLMLKSAMGEFFAEKQRLPKFEDLDDMKIVADKFANHFLAQHHQTITSQISYGIDGLQDGKGMTKFFEKVGIRLDTMFSPLFEQAIEGKLKGELSRQSLIGNTAKIKKTSDQAPLKTKPAQNARPFDVVSIQQDDVFAMPNQDTCYAQTPQLKMQKKLEAEEPPVTSVTESSDNPSYKPVLARCPEEEKENVEPLARICRQEVFGSVVENPFKVPHLIR